MKEPPVGQHRPRRRRRGGWSPEPGGFGGGLSPSQIRLDTFPIYLAGPQWLAMTHERAHRLPASHLPGLTDPAPQGLI